MIRRQAFRAAALVLAVSALAGCGETVATESSVAGLRSLSATGKQGDAKGFAGHKGGMRPGPNGGFMPGLMGVDKLDLSAEQQAQLQAIAEKYRPKKPADGQKAERPGAQLQALLQAETIDADALRAALAERPQPPAEANDIRMQLLVESRAVLTADQRAKLVEQLKAAPMPQPRAADAQRPQPPADAAKGPEKQIEKLGLTAEQKAAFEAFQAKVKAGRPSGERPAFDPAAQRDAMVAFIETGDTAGLEALKPAKVEPAAFPVDEFVALAASLNLEQRKQLLGHGFGGPMGRGFGGPRGHGGPQGQGFGGPRAQGR